jgi:hypothetical protein
VAPTVTFRGGQLTIVAPNSTLQDILMAVRKATGAAVDAPAASASERVATRLGPGTPRQVLAALLEGSRFDYILLGSVQDPAGVRRLILSPRSGGSATESGAPGSSPTLYSRPAPSPAPPPASEEEDAEPTVEPAEGVAPEPQTTPSPEVKTPEQLQEELRQQQEEQQRQQQQQQPPQSDQPQ